MTNTLVGTTETTETTKHPSQGPDRVRAIQPDSADRLRKLCRDDATAIDATDRATNRRDGGQLANTNAAKTTVDDVHGRFREAGRPTGNWADAAIRRLRDDRPDLHARVLLKDLSPHAAMRRSLP